MTQLENIHNAIVEHMFRLAEAEIQTATFTKRLRDCKAEIYTSDNFLFLVSFEKVVALVSRRANTLYDGTKMHDSPNAYSKHHIAKLIEDLNIKELYTYTRKDDKNGYIRVPVE